MRDLRNRVIKKALLYAGVVFVISFFIKRQFSIGLVLGSLVSILNFLLLAKQVESFTSGKKFLVFGFFGYIIRYLLMGLALFIAIKIDLWAFFGCGLGLFMIRLAVYAVTLKAR
jgi:hypothetical protein